MSRPSVFPVLALPALVSAIVFANTLHNAPVYDDPWTLQRLERSAPGGVWDRLWEPRGLTRIVHELDTWLWEGALPGMHVTNIALHALVSLLVAAAALAISGSRRIGLFCGLLFAVHPVHVEAVASITNRNEMLAAVCILLALLLWLRPGGSPWAYAGALVLVLAGLLSKEVAAIGAIPMLFVADLLPRPDREAALSRRLRVAWSRFWPVLLVGIAITVKIAGDLRQLFDRSSIRESVDPRLEGYAQVAATSLAAVPDIFRLLLVPWTLSVDYPLPAVTGLASLRSLAGALMLAAWFLLCGLLIRRSAVAAFAAIWTLVLYLPCANIVPLTNKFVAERYLYVPSFGVCLLLALAADRLLEPAARRGRRWVPVSAAVLLALLGCAFVIRTVVRNADWRDPHTIWSAAVRDGMHTPIVHSNLGVALFGRREYDAAAEEFRRALQLAPRWSAAELNLGHTHLAQRRFEQAEQAYLRTLTLEPDNHRAYYGLGVALGEQGRTDEAIEAELAAARIEPDYADAHLWLGFLLAEQGRLEESAAHYSRAVDLHPEGYDGRRGLGQVLLRLGRNDEAAIHLGEARRLQAGR